MRYVYAHFPINVNIEKNGETGLYEIEIRCVTYPYPTRVPSILTHKATSWARRSCAT